MHTTCGCMRARQYCSKHCDIVDRMDVWRRLLALCRAVLAGVPFCIAAVFLVARPSFLFGGVGLRPHGVAVAAVQVPSSQLMVLHRLTARRGLYTCRGSILSHAK